MDFREKAKELKKDIPALWVALSRRDTPILAKLFALITVAYALSPVDLIPDFIPILGYLDDLLLLPLLVAITLRLIPDKIREESRRQAEGLWENGKPKRWYYALPVIAIWVLLLWAVIKRFLPGG